ncbi:MAG: ATP-binding protein [Myxococcota bacterium]
MSEDAANAGDGLSGDEFRRLAELAPDAMLAHRAGKIIWANQAAADLVKADLQSLPGRFIFDFVRPEDRAALAAGIAKSAIDEKAVKYVHKSVRTTGEVFEAEFQRWPIGGGVMLVVIRDLTVEHQKRSAELRARAFFESTSEAIGISRRGVQVEMNAACAKLMGYDDPSELVGRSILEMLDPSEHERIQDYVTRRARGEPVPSSYVALARRRDGSTFLADLRTTSFQDGDDRLTVVVVRDVSAQQAEEERRRHAEKLEAIGRLAGGVAHDFNNLLAAIMASVEVAAASVTPGSPAYESLETIGEATRHARDLVKQILAFGRREQPRRQPLELSKVIAEALTLARAGTPSTVMLEARLEAHGCVVIGDATELQQVVLNLVANARDAVSANGRIEVSLVQLGPDEAPPEVRGACARLRVRDDGAGMDDRTRAHLFEPYHTTRSAQGGHGLGLAVVHGIVTSLGGVIRVESAPGRGATFDVFLPLSSEQPALAPRPPVAEGGNEHVLLVEDEPLVRKATKRLLETLGYRVTTAVDGVDALERIRAGSREYDLVLSDVTMPRMSGLDLARTLATEHPALKLVLCSGFADGLDEGQARAMGVRALVPKPIDRAALAAALRAALEPGTQR